MNSGSGFRIQSSENINQSIYNRQGWTNDVLISLKTVETEIFLPCYLRTKLKNIVSLDSSTGKGTINIVIILSIYYGQVQKILPDFLERISQMIVLRFKIDQAMKLSEGFTKFTDLEGNERSNYINKKIDEKQQLLSYTIRRTLVVPLISHIFWSPFEYIKFVSTISIDSINSQVQNTKFRVSFNLMDISQQFDKFSVVSFTEEGALGEYNLARSLINAEFTNNRFYSQDNQQQLRSRIARKLRLSKNQVKYADNQDEQQEFNKDSLKIVSFKYAHSVYPVYRHPLVPYISLFLPIIILGFLNLGIFFQDNLRSGKKIMNIAALLVSYIAFLPTIRAKLPPSNSLVISQILLFSMASLTILCMAHTIKVRNVIQYEFLWSQDSIYLATFILTLIIVGMLVLISIAFLFVFYRKFNREQEKTDRKFNRKQWINKECDKQFDRIKQMGYKIIPISQFNEKYKYQKRTQEQQNNKQSFVKNIRRKIVSEFI